MSELPNTWHWTKVGEVSSLNRGVNYKRNQVENIESEDNCLVLRGGNIQDGKIVVGNDVVFVPKELINNDQFLKKGDVVIVGSTGSKHLIGKAAISLKDENKVAFGAFLMLLRPHEGIDKKYFDYFFLTDDYRNIIRELSGGININNIRREHITSIPFPLAPLPEQKRIVAKLDKLFAHLDQLKERLKNVPALLKQFRQAVLTQAVTGKLTEEWRGKNDVDENANQFIERIILERRIDDKSLIKQIDHPFGVPVEWGFSFLQNLGEVARGKSKHRPRNDIQLFGGPYPFIQTGDVAQSDGFIREFKSTYSEFGLSQSRLFPKGTLCITIAANIADTGILNFDACFPDSVVGYIPYRNQYSSKFAMYFIKTIKNDIEQYAPATAQKNINLNILSKIAFPVPPLKEQKEIVRRVESLFAMADKIEASYNALKEKIDQLPQSILGKAFRGELVENKKKTLVEEVI